MNDVTADMEEKETMFRVLDIVRGTTVDGPGFRTSIYLAGCRHHCPGCHNPQSWDFNAGTPMTLDEILKIVDEEEFDVTLSGGDPLYTPQSTALLARKIRERGYGVWVYTGFEKEEIMADAEMMEVIPYIDTVVTGRFVQALRDPDLRFRGSSNQQFLTPSDFGIDV